MARPNKSSALARADQIATDKIRAKLPDLSEQLLQAALGGKRTVICAKCKHANEITVPGDASIGRMLWERASGKPTENRPTTDSDRLIDFLTKMLDETKR